MEEAVRKIATDTHENKREKVNEGKTLVECHPAKDKYRQARSEDRNLFKEKSRQLDEEASIEIERHRSIQDLCKFYKRLNDVKRPFEAQVGPRTVNY
jgi:hypothetical protein